MNLTSSGSPEIIDSIENRIEAHRKAEHAIKTDSWLGLLDIAVRTYEPEQETIDEYNETCDLCFKNFWTRTEAR